MVIMSLTFIVLLSISPFIQNVQLIPRGIPDRALGTHSDLQVYKAPLGLLGMASSPRFKVISNMMAGLKGDRPP